MIYILPFFLCIYYYRYSLAEVLLRTITKIEINYNKWLLLKYPQPPFSIFFNNQQINYNDALKLTNKLSNNSFYEIRYLYNTKIYSIYGSELNNLLYYVNNVNKLISKEFEKKTRIYKWISAEDINNNCYLDTIKKVSGPLGDFYKHYNLNINSDFISDILDKKILLTDYNLDEFTILPSSNITLFK